MMLISIYKYTCKDTVNASKGSAKLSQHDVYVSVIYNATIPRNCLVNSIPTFHWNPYIDGFKSFELWKNVLKLSSQTLKNSKAMGDFKSQFQAMFARRHRA